jgi:hypothetical protein
MSSEAIGLALDVRASSCRNYSRLLLNSGLGGECAEGVHLIHQAIVGSGFWCGVGMPQHLYLPLIARDYQF